MTVEPTTTPMLRYGLYGGHDALQLARFAIRVAKAHSEGTESPLVRSDRESLVQRLLKQRADWSEETIALEAEARSAILETYDALLNLFQNIGGTEAVPCAVERVRSSGSRLLDAQRRALGISPTFPGE